MELKVKEILKQIQLKNTVEVELKYLNDVLNHCINKYNLKLGSKFQDNSIWPELKQIDYIASFIVGENCNNTMVFNLDIFEDESDYKFRMLCADGLQRLIILRKFLNNEIKVFGRYLNEFKDKDTVLEKKIIFKFM